MRREHQSWEQTTPDTEMEPPPASTSLGNPFPRKKSWILAACHKCVEAKHLVKHKEISGADYSGKYANNCRLKECRQMLSGLWRENFLRSKNCRHGNIESLSREALSVSRSSQRLHNPNDLTTSTKPKHKVTKRKHNIDHTSRRAIKKQTKQQSNSCITAKIAALGESATIDRQSCLSVLVCKHSLST